jgi:D-alanyl-lipoteichoic acid acyltransferase DltB (MBOAT superfamily)
MVSEFRRFNRKTTVAEESSLVKTLCDECISISLSLGSKMWIASFLGVAAADNRMFKNVPGLVYKI